MKFSTEITVLLKAIDLELKSIILKDLKTNKQAKQAKKLTALKQLKAA